MPVDQLNNLALQPTLPPRLHNGHEPLTEAQIEAVGVRHRLQDVAARSLDNTQRVLMQELSQVPRDVRRGKTPWLAIALRELGNVVTY